MSAHTIANKWRRAVRRNTGMQLTPEQLQELGGYGFLELLSRIESNELCPAKPAPTSSETTGSTTGGTVKPRVSGKLPPPVDGQSFIEALARAN